MIGTNLIGRMYRPNKILKNKTKGFSLNSFYKNNFGERKKLNMNFSLDFDAFNNKETLIIEINSNIISDNANLILVNNGIESTDITTPITGIRTLIKPLKLGNDIDKSKLSIDGMFLHISLYINSTNQCECEFIDTYIYPTLIQGKEFIAIEINSTSLTKIRIIGDTVSQL